MIRRVLCLCLALVATTPAMATDTDTDDTDTVLGSGAAERSGEEGGVDCSHIEAAAMVTPGVVLGLVLLARRRL